MTIIDPVKASHEITETYTRYLKSLVQPRQANLASAISSAIDESITSESGIIKGPFLEATPPYTTGLSIRELVAEGTLSQEFLRLGSNSFPLDRPVYTHQEASVRKIAAGRNLLIATGTGSGKTESFLIPIIDYLLRQKESGALGPGVRALLLYPMNALANDQVKRIREILGSYPEITFGRYTGETEPDPKKAQEKYLSRNGSLPTKNELISRTAMQQNPPNILLTNYAMLEYLLLRPEDHEIFNGQFSDQWKFIVADEAHTYDGAHGVEVAMLLNKLRERVDPDRKIQTIGTTATIGGTDQDKETFASNFFGNEYSISESQPDVSDLVTPRREAIPLGSWGPIEIDDWLKINDSETFSAFTGAEPTKPDDLVSLFHTEISVSKLRRALLELPLSVESAAQAVFGANGEDEQEALVNIVAVGTELKDRFGRPAFSARYHLFASATEGVFSCMSPTPHASLNRRVTCESCQRPSFEIAGCKRCGASYFMGYRDKSDGKNRFVPTSKKDESYEPPIYIYLEGAEPESENEDEANYDEVLGESKPPSIELKICIDCGIVSGGDSEECSECGSGQLITSRFAENANGCAFCSGRSRNLLRKLESGNNAAASVLASQLYEEIPPESGTAADSFAGQGRKLMIFSDNRQQAAFFAPYLEDSYKKILWRKLILRGLKEAEEVHSGTPLTGPDLKTFVKTHLDSSVMGSEPITSAELDKQILQRIHLEMTSTETQISLEGIGLLTWAIDLPEDPMAFAPLVAQGFTYDQARGYVHELLTTLRSGGILSVELGVDVSGDIFLPRTGPLYIRGTTPDKRTKSYSWLPAKSSNSRLNYTRRVLEALDLDLDPRSLLSGVWEAMTMSSGILAGYVESSSGNAQFQLNHNKILVRSLEQTKEIFTCDTCRRKSIISVGGVCLRFNCHGALMSASKKAILDGLEKSYYAINYRQDSLFGLTASEHTAQLDTDYASKVQQEFIEGKINVLSSSTTFELGVDVGDLQTVMLRNMPPSVANYIQRAGRAGRRADSAALILTYAQRRPHDLSMFADPVSMVAGQMRSPFVELSNPRIFQRHAYSLFFSAYFKAAGLSKLGKVEDFYSPEKSGPGNQILDWVEHNSQELRIRFDKILPAALSSKSSTLWLDTRSGFADLFTSVRENYLAEVVDYQELIETAAAAGKYAEAGSLKKALNSITSKDLIGFLSSRNLIPKYGFPVDTVPLVPRKGVSKAADKVDLDRDLSIAIFEYAPGNTVIAAGVVWESVGLQKPFGTKDTEKGFIRVSFAVCPDCNEYQEKTYVEDDSFASCTNCRSTSLKTRNYVKPLWGFIAKGGSERPSESGRSNGAWSRGLHLRDAGIATVVSGRNTPPGVEAELRNLATIVLINSGPSNAGYHWCTWCDFAAPSVSDSKPGEHERPYSGEKKCTNTFREIVSLGHSFQTDIVEVVIDLAGSSFVAQEEVLGVAHALLEGASQGLQIIHDDIDVVLLPSTGKKIRLALVDAVPAGAGYAKLIAQNMDAVFEAAFERLDRCECGPETSCYKCLRSYRNQRHHDDLHRGATLEVMRHILKK
jgi:ATP-dependent helicase YprA (DUF1998 family)